jgi:kynurenine formamidase
LVDLKVYDLEQPRTRNMPLHPVHKIVGYSFLLHRKHRDTPLSSPKTRTGSSGILIMTEHTGTHFDALCHQAYNHRLHGNVEVTAEIETPYGFKRYGIENVDAIAGRGVLLDVAAEKGLEELPKHYRISAEELRRCAKVENVEIRKGDVVLVRTGYAKYWNDSSRYDEAAGVSPDGARWLASVGVRAVGADNMGWEVDDGQVDPDLGVTLPCHALMLVDHGIHIIENMNLEALGAEKVYEFFFVCTPLKFVGATGSPVRPIAITGVQVQ